MKNTNYTQFNENSLHHFSNNDNLYDAIDFLKKPESFRNFDSGLIELMHRKGYLKELNCYELADILYAKLQAINSSITRTTVDSWFQGTHRPKIEAGYRKQIYEICFAMKLNYTETMWFFQHVYYDRAFNCHTIDEAIYCYAFLNKLSYAEANELIVKVNQSAPSCNSTNNAFQNYTLFAKNQIENMKSTDELIAFLSDNKSNFDFWNHSAYKEITNRISQLIPTEQGKKEINNIKRTAMRKNTISGVIPKISAQKEWGLLMQEFFSKITCVEDLENISGFNIQSNAFILRGILSPHSLETVKVDKVNIPYVVKNNFPTRKTMSETLSLDKVSQSKSYDCIRKLIILLNFYIFWVGVDLEPEKYSKKGFSASDLYHIFLDELNSRLYVCGYEDMYAGNPYDWLFMCASLSTAPLQYFRDCIGEILSDEDE